MQKANIAHILPADEATIEERQVRRSSRRRAIASVALLGLLLTVAGCGPSAAPPVATPTPHPAPHQASPLDAKYADYNVGAYYFSGWSHGQNNNLSPILTQRYKTLEPLIGWYDDSQSQVDKNITQAADAGIKFFAFDWYDIAESKSPTDRTLNEGLGYYLTSSQRHRLNFALTYVDQAPFIPPASKWPALVKTWISYFKMPGYVTVNGKPLFIVFSPEHLREVFKTTPELKAALQYLRTQAKAAGLPGVTIAAAATIAAHSNPYRIFQLSSEGYDASTGYNYHSLGNEQYRVPAPYENLVKENIGVWNRVAAHLPPYMPVITSGWDQRVSSREQTTAIIYDGRTPQKFACFATDARHWVDTHPTATTKERVIMVFAWNEIGEGGSIIPNHRDGTGYTDALRSVFGASGQAPTTPTGCTTS